MEISGSIAKALSRPFGGARLAHRVGQPDLAAQRLLDQFADARGAARLVLVAVEFARDRDGVEREAVGGGVDLRVDDVGAGQRAGAGDDRQQPRMIRREDRQFGDAARRVETDAGGKPLIGRLGGAHETRMGDLVRQIDLEPIGRIMARDIGLAQRLRPVGEFASQFGLARRRRAGRD